MVRSLVGFAAFAVIAILALKLLGGLLGFAIGLIGTLIWFAFLGFIFYLILKVFAPGTARRVRETIAGDPPA